MKMDRVEAKNDKQVIRELAKKLAEIAAKPEMAEKKRQWRALKDLKAERPMVMVETYFIENFVSGNEISCKDVFYRGIEWYMRLLIRHAEEVGDDIVIEPCWHVWWNIEAGDYGIPIETRHAAEASVAYVFDHPVKKPEDLEKLKKRTFKVDRDRTMKTVEMLQYTFGDILTVTPPGIHAYNASLTYDLFRLIGNENLLLWMFDEPEALHKAMSYLCNDRLEYIDFMEKENLLALNNHCTVVGSGSYGCTSALPQTDYTGVVRAKDMWIWCESQETTMISPDQFSEFFLPYMAKVAQRFGLVYYGCCEPVHDRWKYIGKALTNIRAVSVSPWCNMNSIAEMIGNKIVFSRKPMPSPISGVNPDWDMLLKDIKETTQAAKNCNLEFIYRDLYDIKGDVSRLRKWTEMVRSQF